MLVKTFNKEEYTSAEEMISAISAWAALLSDGSRIHCELPILSHIIFLYDEPRSELSPTEPKLASPDETSPVDD